MISTAIYIEIDLFVEFIEVFGNHYFYNLSLNAPQEGRAQKIITKS